MRCAYTTISPANRALFCVLDAQHDVTGNPHTTALGSHFTHQGLELSGPDRDADTAHKPDSGLLTAREQQLVSLLGDCWSEFIQILGNFTTNPENKREFAAHIHDLQHAIMAQAASRAYPELYRLQGRGF